jgi:UDPglucose 6-dehydrogenase
MKIAVFGTGYVGLVQGAVLADAGHQVICVDVDAAKIDRLRQGSIPIFEPGLEPMVKETVAQGRLLFTTDAAEAINKASVLFIAVGTPPDEDGSADLQYVLKVAQTIGEHMTEYKVVLNKSTVPVGTADKVARKIQDTLDSRGASIPCDVVSNPEFLKEGAAVNDCKRPDRIIIGTESERAEKILRELYAPFNRNHDKVIVMSPRSAELTKYAANCMLATKISFMNEMANLAERLGADIEEVRIGIGSDPRIGYAFIYPGAGYGGSCFPKDVKALIKTASTLEYDSRILNAVEIVNNRQKQRLLDFIDHHYGSAGIAGKTFALWGLAFKPQTDDMREATSRVVMEGLWQRGARVQAYDPEAMNETQRIYGSRDDLLLCGTKESALRGADGLILCTEWKHFWTPDFDEMVSLLAEPVIFDGRNIYDPEKMREQGIAYYGIGRGLSVTGVKTA